MENHKKRKLELRELRAKLKDDVLNRKNMLDMIVGEKPQIKEDDGY